MASQPLAVPGSINNSLLLEEANVLEVGRPALTVEQPDPQRAEPSSSSLASSANKL